MGTILVLQFGFAEDGSIGVVPFGCERDFDGPQDAMASLARFLRYAYMDGVGASAVDFDGFTKWLRGLPNRSNDSFGYPETGVSEKEANEIGARWHSIAFQLAHYIRDPDNTTWDDSDAFQTEYSTEVEIAKLLGVSPDERREYGYVACFKDAPGGPCRMPEGHDGPCGGGEE